MFSESGAILVALLVLFMGIVAAVWVLVKFIDSDLPQPSDCENPSKQQSTDTSGRTLGLGRSRIATGLLATYFAAGPVAILFFLSDPTINRTDNLLAGVVVLLNVALTLVGLPLLGVLRILGLASWMGFAVVGIVVGLLVGIWVDVQMHSSAIAGAVYAAAFSLGAKVPLMRSANDS
jgi:hypothetical protein